MKKEHGSHVIGCLCMYGIRLFSCLVSDCERVLKVAEVSNEKLRLDYARTLITTLILSTIDRMRMCGSMEEKSSFAWWSILKWG